jgi:osmotically-inducible protein OsmY
MDERFGRQYEDEERRYYEPPEARREVQYRDDRGREDWESRDRGFLDRATDEVRSWFGDDDAERRRREDMRRERWAGRPADRRVGRESWGRRADDFDERAWARQWGYADGPRWSEDPWSERSRSTSWSERFRAERSAGPYAGRGPKGYRRSDDRIREDLCDMLCEHGGIDARDVEVQIVNGEVTLLGFVRSRQEKRLAEDLAEDVSGVRDVHNQLRVQSPESQSGSMGAQPGAQDWRNRAA